MTGQFTGRHMALIMVCFFAVIITVNLIMASSAVRTFGGVVVQNSYVASQRYNGWIASGRAQQRLGWHAVANGTPDGTLMVSLSGPAGPIGGALVAAEVEHPLGRLPGRTLLLKDAGNGRYIAAHALPAGRWKLRIQARLDGKDARFVQEVRL
ncbi:FixH family protein [Sphingomonas sp. MS122]|uniref:FixH family protein n=1 Tax=Sphingomonas sp. MS122 TaxID=3412683 RepID=UPI003C2F7108